jgi:hypothetical protein
LNPVEKLYFNLREVTSQEEANQDQLNAEYRFEEESIIGE